MNSTARVRGFLLVTLCYWGFTLSDGALRMLVLLHLHEQGQTAWGLALVLLAPLSHPAYWFTRCRMPRSTPADATA